MLDAWARGLGYTGPMPGIAIELERLEAAVFGGQ